MPSNPLPSLGVPASPPKPAALVISEAAIARAATTLRCSPAAVQAVVAVESPKGAFLPDGRPPVLFEAHYFSRLTKRKFDATYPAISSKRWNPALYKGQLGEYRRLQSAFALDPDAALMSASWGQFQIMGANFALCGFADVRSFVAAMQTSAQAQLDAFCHFILKSRLDDEMRERRWTDFARAYNGPQFHQHGYDRRLAGEYAKIHKAQG